METAVNAPARYPDFNVGSLMYGLAHEAKEKEDYLETLKQRGDRYLILDNGADELGTGLAGEGLAQLLEEVRPSELILPDVLGDSKSTIEASEGFYHDWLYESGALEGGMKLMGVAQGEDFQSFMECYTRWVEWKPVKVVGIPYDIEFWTSEAVGQGESSMSDEEYPISHIHAQKRLEILSYLKRAGHIRKPIHLLGTNNLWELRQYQSNELRGLIRSNDTTAPFAAATVGKDFRQGQDHDKDWPRLDFDVVWEGKEQVELAVWNLYEYFTACQDTEAIFNLGCLVGSRFPQWARLI